MRRHLLRDGQQVSSLPCWCSSLGSSWQMPTPAPAQDATTWRLTDATARSPKHSAWLGKVIGLTRADRVMPPPTSSIPIARGNTPGVALMRPVMLVSVPCPSGPATRRRAKPGHMSVWVCSSLSCLLVSVFASNIQPRPPKFRKWNSHREKGRANVMSAMGHNGTPSCKGAGRAATALLGAASCRGLAQSPAATATCHVKSVGTSY